MWKCRNVIIPQNTSRQDFNNIYSLKRSVLKKRTSVSVFALKFDNFVNSMYSKEVDKFPEILNEVLENLNLAQKFTGDSLYVDFKSVANRTPHLLAHLWNLMSQRTYWKEYTSETEKYSRFQDVSSYTAKHWVLPGENAIGEAKYLSGNAIGFLSGVRDILESLSGSLKSLDIAIDSLWANRLDF